MDGAGPRAVRGPARPRRGRGAPEGPTSASATLAREPAPGVPGLAFLLAHAFLAAPDWRREDLVAAGAALLGARRRWLGPLVRGVLAGYPRRPEGAPRELARWIAAQPALTDAVARAAARGEPVRPARYLPPAPEEQAFGDRSAPGGVEASGARDLAWLAREVRLTPGELDWFADTRHWNRRAGAPALHHYRYVWRARPGRAPRLLEIPGIRLRTVQRRVLDHLLAPIPLHEAAHGFVPGRSARTGAALHTGADVVIALDLVSFFARVPPGRVFGVFRQAGFPEATAHALTGLCTHEVPDAVLRAMPDGGSAEDRFALARALRTAHLPQGAPSSPALANLAVRRLDARLSGWAAAAGGSYTRYADDLAFSGPADLARRADAFVRGVERIVVAEGHTVNRRKTRVRGAAVRQTVTGVVVNARTNVARTDYDALKAILHNCRVHGPESQRRGQADFRAHLAGRISWVESLNPQRGRRLRDAFERISW
ncbi:RNA-directed DNA polymerase [Arthrobacter pityocampae]|uniref:RNA-directed DNA polymerase n=1 Tax=Arthrobacter pityocampae TaxID=547334 RepID=A0A2S5IX68_9MICC|nr:reverse transcriptase family protein [Arthrobacter pityocampae]PPB49134.1 RNA-directed DNA polymerase [Arthrobacter pityocampae]